MHQSKDDNDQPQGGPIPAPGGAAWQGVVERLGWGGVGVGHLPDGRTVLLTAPLALYPGEEVAAEIVLKARHAEGRVTGWVRRDARRVEAGCPVAARCGGCRLWEAGEMAGELKRQMVADLFHRSLPQAPAWEWLPAPPEALRHRIQLHWDGERLGYFAQHTHEIVEVGGCPMAVDAVSRAIPLLKQALKGGTLPAEPARWELATGTPPKGVLAVREGEPALHFELPAGGGAPRPAKEAQLEHFMRGQKLRQHAGGFFQVSPPWAWAAFADTFAAWELAGGTLFDLYSGGGFFSRMLGGRFKRFVLVEDDAASLADARRNVVGRRAAFHRQDVAAFLRRLREPPVRQDVLLLDPPRAGLGKDVCALLRPLAAGTLVLAGCDGASFCRDVKLLAPAWRLDRLAVIDLFPNTVQVECLGHFRREA